MCWLHIWGFCLGIVLLMSVGTFIGAILPKEEIMEEFSLEKLESGEYVAFDSSCVSKKGKNPTYMYKASGESSVLVVDNSNSVNIINGAEYGKLVTYRYSFREQWWFLLGWYDSSKNMRYEFHIPENREV